MEKQLKDYLVFIQKASTSPTKDLAKYHEQMLKNFQHERLIHLLVTFFFVFFTILFLVASVIVYFLFFGNDLVYFLPLFGLTLILLVLSIAYVRHYYFLENTIQKLYKYTKALNID